MRGPCNDDLSHLFSLMCVTFYLNGCVGDSGKCLGRFTNENKTTPYCVKLNPDADKQHLFIVGCADKKIYTVSRLVAM